MCFTKICVNGFIKSHVRIVYINWPTQENKIPSKKAPYCSHQTSHCLLLKKLFILFKVIYLYYQYIITHVNA